jgi:hypothetical protein
MTTPVSQHLIVDPATLIYENFTTVQLTTILTELGEKDLSKKKMESAIFLFLSRTRPVFIQKKLSEVR